MCINRRTLVSLQKRGGRDAANGGIQQLNHVEGWHCLEPTPPEAIHQLQQAAGIGRKHGLGSRGQQIRHLAVSQLFRCLRLQQIVDARRPATERALGNLRHFEIGNPTQKLSRLSLNALGVWRDRPAKPLSELAYLSPEDKAARQVIDAYIAYRAEAGVSLGDAVAEFVREAAYNWANRLLALRCMEARGIIDEVILQKEI